jgi:hypothetical protein
LQQLQTEWARWLAEYHDTPHTSLTELTGQPTTPLDFYLRFLPNDVQHLEELALSDLFLIEASRRVNADGTIRLAAKFWEVRAEWAGTRVLVRFNPEDPKRVLCRPLQDSNAPFQQAFPVQ